MDTPGVTIEQHLDKMGQRATGHVGVRAAGRVVPAANRLGEEGDGFKLAMQTLDFTRPRPAIAPSASRRRVRARGGVREGARHLRRADRDATRASTS